MFFEQTSQCGIKIQGKRLEQGLRSDGVLIPFCHHLLIQYALVGGVLVDEIHSLGAFSNNVGLTDLAYHSQEG